MLASLEYRMDWEAIDEEIDNGPYYDPDYDSFGYSPRLDQLTKTQLMRLTTFEHPTPIKRKEEPRSIVNCKRISTR